MKTATTLALLARDRLVAGREVDDREPPVAEHAAAVGRDGAVVGAAMYDRRVHALDQLRVGRVAAEESADPAHGLSVCGRRGARGRRPRAPRAERSQVNAAARASPRSRHGLRVGEDLRDGRGDLLGVVGGEVARARRRRPRAARRRPSRRRGSRRPSPRAAAARSPRRARGRRAPRRGGRARRARRPRRCPRASTPSGSGPACPPPVSTSRSPGRSRAEEREGLVEPGVVLVRPAAAPGRAGTARAARRPGGSARGRARGGSRGSASGSSPSSSTARSRDERARDDHELAPSGPSGGRRARGTRARRARRAAGRSRCWRSCRVIALGRRNGGRRIVSG